MVVAILMHINHGHAQSFPAPARVPQWALPASITGPARSATSGQPSHAAGGQGESRDALRSRRLPVSMRKARRTLAMGRSPGLVGYERVSDLVHLFDLHLAQDWLKSLRGTKSKSTASLVPNGNDMPRHPRPLRSEGHLIDNGLLFDTRLGTE